MKWGPEGMSKFVFGAGIYNLLLGLGMFVPPVTQAMGLNITDPALAQIIGILLIYTTVVQVVSSRDLKKYGSLIAWEGVLRWSAAIILFRYGFFGHLGVMAGVLGVIDFLIGTVFIFVVPKTIGERVSDLLLLKKV